MIDTPFSAARRGGAAGASAIRQFLEARRWVATGPPSQQQHPGRPLLAFEEIYCDATGALSSDAGANGGPLGGASATDHHPRPFTAVFLHGLLGSSRNWRTYCRGLAQAAALEHGRPYRLILADLRAHGRTALANAAAAEAAASSSSAAGAGAPPPPAFGPPHTLAAAAADVRALLASHPALAGRGPDALVGLSLGGKVALEVVRQQQQQRQGQQQQHAGQERRGEGGGAAAEGTTHRAAGQAGGVGSAARSRPAAAPAPTNPPPPPPLGPSADAAARAMPRQVWVLDSQPGVVEREGDGATSVGRIMRLLRGVPQPLPSRQALYDLLAREQIPHAVAQWLGGALQHQPAGGSGGGGGGSGDGASSPSPPPPTPSRQQQQQQQQQRLVWEFDVPACAELYRSYRAADLWSVMERPPAGVAVHLIRGERSDRWDAPGALERVGQAEQRWREAAAAAAAAAQGGGGGGGGVGELRVHVLEKATHWLQASNPKGLTSMLVPHFK